MYTRRGRKKEKKRTKNVTKKNDQTPSNIKCNLFIWIKKKMRKKRIRENRINVYINKVDRRYNAKYVEIDR